MSESYAIAEREIRAPAAQVYGIASLASQAQRWLWRPQRVAEINSSRELPDGTLQLLVKDGDKIRDRVVDTEDNERVRIDSKYLPRKQEIPGRHLLYELLLVRGPGTTRASLSMCFLADPARDGVAEQKKWRRHLEQCLARLASLAEAAVEQEDP